MTYSTMGTKRTPASLMAMHSFASLRSIRIFPGGACRTAAGALMLVALLQSPLVWADPPAQPQGVVNLSTSASTEVEKDWISVTLSTQREGGEAAPLQTALKQALDAALQVARPAARPGQIELRAGNFSIHPRYTGKGQTNGWQGSTELVIEGRDMATIAELTGRIRTLTISRVVYSLSREQRQKAEADVTAQAIASYRQRAGEVARLFGYASYTLREVQLSSNGGPEFPQPREMRAMSAMAADQPLPIEAGKATVTVRVDGSIQLLK